MHPQKSVQRGEEDLDTALEVPGEQGLESINHSLGAVSRDRASRAGQRSQAPKGREDKTPKGTRPTGLKDTRQ